MKPEEQLYYAHKRERNGRVVYINSSPNERWLALFHSKDPVVKVRLRPRKEGDPESSYWGWVSSTHPDRYTMVWPSLAQFEICFPYGSKASADNGNGYATNLIVEEVTE